MRRWEWCTCWRCADRRHRSRALAVPGQVHGRGAAGGGVHHQPGRAGRPWVRSPRRRNQRSDQCLQPALPGALEYAGHLPRGAPGRDWSSSGADHPGRWDIWDQRLASPPGTALIALWSKRHTRPVASRVLHQEAGGILRRNRPGPHVAGGVIRRLLPDIGRHHGDARRAEGRPAAVSDERRGENDFERLRRECLGGL